MFILYNLLKKNLLIYCFIFCKIIHESNIRKIPFYL